MPQQQDNETDAITEMVADLKNRTEPMREQHQRMFKRNLKFWMVRWSIGFIATAWFTIAHPEHGWLWGIAIGTAALSLVVMYIGNRYITNKFMSFDQKMDTVKEQQMSKPQNGKSVSEVGDK